MSQETKSTFVISGTDFLEGRKPCVYIWERDGEAIYVGQSSVGLSRVFASGHHALCRGVLPTDQIKVMFFADHKLAENVEWSLIHALKPKLNDWNRKEAPYLSIRDSDVPDKQKLVKIYKRKDGTRYVIVNGKKLPPSEVIDV